MSKKSRKRNKKILGALAAGLGAMALMRGRNQGTNLGVSGTNKAKFTSDVFILFHVGLARGFVLTNFVLGV